MKTFNPTKSLSILAGAVALTSVPLSGQAQSLIDQWNFNESSGTTAANSVGGGASATLMGSASFDGSGSVTLNGATGSYINLGGNLLSGLSSVTLEGWFTYAVPNNNVHLFSFDDGSGTGTQNGGAWNGNYLRYNVYDSGNGHNGISYVEVPNLGNPNGGVLNGSSSLPQNALVQVAVVYDPVNSVESLYVNGALQSTVTGTLAPISSISDAGGTLGASPWSGFGDPYLTGTINQFSIYSGALSGTQIANDFTAGPITAVPEPSSVALAVGGLTLLGILRRRNAR